MGVSLKSRFGLSDLVGCWLSINFLSSKRRFFVHEFIQKLIIHCFHLKKSDFQIVIIHNVRIILIVKASPFPGEEQSSCEKFINALFILPPLRKLISFESNNTLPMRNKLQTENIISSARNGNQNAADEFYALLAERFSPIITRELKKNHFLSKRINSELAVTEICESAISELKESFPINSRKWSLQRAMNVLHNAITDFIANKLTEFAKNGNEEAEKLLFHLLREKLMERVNLKNWRKISHERKDK